MNPLVSIIIPTYNRAHLIGETLDSVLAQTYTNWECIVVDDGSTDATAILLADYCKKDQRFQYHHRPNDKPKGANACRNYGFELSKGEYVNWFDDDDVMLDLFLEEKIIKFNKDINLTICSGYYVDRNLKNKVEIVLNENTELYRDYVLWTLHIFMPSVLFRKGFLVGKELFSAKIVRGQETELFSRLFFELSSTEYLITNKYLYLYRQHQQTKSTASKNKYVKIFVKSQTFIALENLKREKRKNDIAIKLLMIKNLLYYFFRGIDNEHYSNSRSIIKNIIPFIIKKNIFFTFELLVYSFLLLLLKRGSYNIEKRIMNYRIK